MDTGQLWETKNTIVFIFTDSEYSTSIYILCSALRNTKVVLTIIQYGISLTVFNTKSLIRLAKEHTITKV